MKDDDIERRQFRLTEEQLDYIVKGVKQEILAEIYAEIGKGVVKRILWMIGTVGAGVSAYFAIKGWR